MIVTLTLAPALVTLTHGRDVDAMDYIRDVDSGSLAAWIGRLATATLLLTSAIIVFVSPQKTLNSTKTKKRIRWLAISIAAFCVGHTILPSFLGAVPNFEPSTLYAFAVIAAAYSARSLPSATFFLAMKTSLLAVMLGGLIAAVIQPEIALQYVSADLRLPGLDFRYWGIGSGPNNIAPLALLLLILTTHTPYKSLGLNLLAVSAGVITLLLSQSQTTWAAALMVYPLFVFYSKTPKPIKKARINPLLAIAVLLGIGAGLILIVWEASHVDLSNLMDASLRLESGSLVSRDESTPDSFTGRTAIWETAMNTWRDHPLFGYGLTAWGVDFRLQNNMPFASHAHNQVMQSMSVGGSLALAALTLYVFVLVRFAALLIRHTNGLALAILGFTLIRGLTEGPFDTNTLLSGELLIHFAIISVISTGIMRKRGNRARSTKGSKPPTLNSFAVSWDESPTAQNAN